MPLTLYVDGPRWREHLRRYLDRHPGTVPVCKGNGYGLGLAKLARRAAWLGTPLVAVGTYGEVADVATRFAGDLLVMTPWRPFLDPPDTRRVLHTVGRMPDLTALAGRGDRPRVVLECRTSLGRHGVPPELLPDLAARCAGLRVEGLALHLPISGAGRHGAEVAAVVDRARAAGLPTGRVFVSHLTDTELTDLGARYPDISWRPRVGTDLWLGDRGVLQPRATVLDVHPVHRGDRVGYRQRPLPRDGHVLVVAGGTTHGVGLVAPASGASPRGRAVALARGGLDAAGLALSPFRVAGRQRWFVEPPHMQVSLLFLPGSVPAPAVGEELAVDVRYTTTRFDRVLIS